MGIIVSINVSQGGLPKLPIAEGFITPLGLEGDRQAHPEIHGGPRQAILLVSGEVIDDLVSRGYSVYPGALGENLTVRGLDFRQLRPGDQVRAGGVLLEITRPRGPCSQVYVYGRGLAAEIYDSRVKEGDYTSPRWGMSGLYAAVLSPGPVATGDIIAVVATLA
jgi:MOSC domain-containing protein YiiM